MVRHGWQRIMLLLILAFFSQAAISQTIDFEDQTYTNNQDLGSNVLTFGNFKFTIEGNWIGHDSEGNNGSNAIGPALGTSFTLTIESIDGSEFHFESFWNSTGPGFERYSSIKGFKNGLVTGESVVSPASGINLMPDYLDDIDKVEITAVPFLWVIFDDFVFSAPSETANVVPLVTAPSAPTVTEDQTDIAIADDIQLAEADLEDSHILTFSIRGGTLSLGENGITFGGSGNKSASFTAQGTVADLNVALDAATFTPSPNASGIGAGEITFVANDGKADSNTATVAFNIDNVNDDPSFSSTAVTELKGDQSYEYEITISDIDNDELTLTATTKPDWLTFDNTGEGTVTTLAGSGARVNADGTGTEASFYDPFYLTVDGKQNVYVADGHRIRKITPEGVVTTFAGDVSSGNQDGIGTAARFRFINDLAVDKDNNIYVADNQNVSIRKITPEGVVSTFVTNMSDGQTTFSNPASLSIDGSGNIYLKDQSTAFWKITPSGEVSAIVNPKTYGGPGAIAVDQSGNIYQVVNGTQVVILTTNGNEVILAGTSESGDIDGTGTSARFKGISSIYVDNPGIVYLTDGGNNKIRKITPQGAVTTLAGTGQAGKENGFGTAASFWNPEGLVVDRQGYVYVTDEANNLIRKIAPSSYTLTGNAASEVGTHDVLLTLSDGNGGSATQTFTIFVSDVVEFDDSASNGLESESTAEVPVSLSKALTTEASVDYAISGTAQSGVDHNFSAGTLNFAAGETTKNITISGIVDDSEIEVGETIVLTLSNAVGIDLGNQNVHTYTINDNDVSAANAGADAATCNRSLNLAGNAPDGANGETGAWSIISGENGSFQNATDPNTRFYGRSGNTYTLRWTLTKGGNTSTDDVQITMNVSPVANAGADKEIRGVGNLSGNIYEGVTGMWTIYEGDGNGVLGDPTSPTSTFSGTDGEDYTLVWTLSNEYCGSNTDLVDIEYFKNEAPEFISTPVTSVNDNESYRYYALISDKDDAPSVSASVKPDWLTLSSISGGILHNFAGATESGNTNGFATNARFKFPNDVAVDSEGNLFVADQGNNVIKKITTDGQVSVFATGFNGPAGITVAASGNVYVADTFNNLVKKITKDGIVSNIDFVTAPYGIAVDAQENVYYSSLSGNKIYKYLQSSGLTDVLAGSGTAGKDDGTGNAATFNGPAGLDLDANGNVYVADWGNELIRKITPAGAVSTYAGSGDTGSKDSWGTLASFDGPKGIAVDVNGNVYVTENSLTSGRIRKITDRFVETLPGTIPTSTNKLTNPEGLTVDKQGNLYIADFNNNTIKFLPAQAQAVLSGSAVGQRGTHEVTLKNDDGHGGVVEQKFTITVNDVTAPVFTSATTVNFAENGTGAAYTVTATDANDLTYSLGDRNDEDFFNIDAGVVTFKSAPDHEEPRNEELDNDYVINVIASDGNNSSNQNVTISVTNVNETPFFTSTAVKAVNDNATYSYRITPSDPDGDALTVTATQKPDWLELSSTSGGQVSTVAGVLGTNTSTDGPNGTFGAPWNLATDAQGNIYVTEYSLHIVRKIAVDGTVSTIAGVNGMSGDQNGTGSETRLNTPRDIAVDAAGNVYVTDNGNHKIKKITPEGVVSTFVGSGDSGSQDGTGIGASFSFPDAMAIDADGNLYVGHSSVIRKVTPAGVVSTLAGESFSDGHEDGPLAEARFSGQIDYISVDKQGNIYLLENQDRLRKISKDGIVSTLNTGDFLHIGSGLEVDDAGNVYFLEEYSVVYKISKNGDITAIAGERYRRSISDGDGMDATTARLQTAFGLAFDPNGDLLITDVPLIRKITFPSLKLSGDATGQTGTHDVTLKADDGNGKTVEQKFTITINDATDPVITSTTTASFAENGTGTAYTVTATDTNGLTYSLGTDNDESLFNIDGTSGTVTFKTSPDFESPADANTDNAYVINVIASDGSNAANQDVTITVTNVNEAPSFTSTPIASVNDNTNYSYTIEINDPEGDALTIAAATKPDWLSLSMSQEESVSTIAGSGETDGSGTGVPKDGIGTEAGFGNPGGIVTDASGNIYVLDPVANAVRKVDQNKLVTTLAGNGTAEHKDGTGTNAAFLGVNDLAIDPQGNLYITSNNSIRKMTPDGVVSTFVGPDNGAEGEVDGVGAEARFSAPVGITYDATTNALFVNDARTGKIRKVTLDGVVTTFAGSGTAASIDGSGTNASFNSPQGIAVDNQGNFYIAEANSRRVRKVTPSGVVTTLAGSDSGFADGTGTEAKFGYITSLTVDSEGVVYVADGDNNRIRQISTEGVVSTLLGGGAYAYVDGTFDVARLSGPQKITIDNNENLVFNEWSRRLRRVNIDRGHRLLGSAVGQKGTFNVSLTANDGTNDAVEQNFTITVNDVTNPVFTSGPAVNFAENATGTVYTVAATDVNTVTYSLGTGNDEALFDIMAGVVTFKVSPDFENPADANTDNAYVINVIASDGINSANQDVTITVTNVDDTDPVFTSATTASFAENGTGTAYMIVATDANALTYSLGSGNDEALFDVDGTSGAVTFKASPDFENPADANTDNAYVINVIASDGINSANQDVTITVTNVDDTDPIFTSATAVDFAENGTGTAYTIAATDANALTYSLGTGNDEALFDVDGGSGVVTFKTSPDFENPADANTDNAYIINVIASDGINSVNQDVTITVTNVDDTDPVFISATAASFAENGTGTAYTIAATDANALTYSLGTGNDEVLFDVDGTSGAVTFKTSPDFENPADANTDNAYLINVIASDGINSVNQDVTITVTNVDDTDPVFTSATTASFAENGTGTAYTIAATDANALTYSLGSGNDEGLFNVDGISGAVTFKTSPDFENPADANTDNAYVINVIASDGINTVNQDVTIIVTNVDDTDPVFTSATTASFAENGTSTAYTIAATDANVLTYSLGSGNDEALFDVDGGSGAVTFKTSPDFENPADANTDNAYVINVIASDGINSVNQNVTITVTNVDDTDPVFTSATTTSFVENGTGTAYTAMATDANTLTYSLGNQKDETLFNMDQNSGVVTFKTAPDFENPADGDANNAYVINVIASDGINSANQDVTITVTDADEIAPTVDISSQTSEITSGVFTVTVAYSETVTGFTVGDITVTNGTAGNFTSVIVGKEWTADITPASDGAVTINIAAATATDAAGNENTAATEFSIQNDETAPGVTLSAGALTGGAYTVTAQFSETVIGFTQGDITISGGTISGFTAVDGDTYTFSVSSDNPSATVDITAGVATDAAGNGNTVASQLSLVFNSSPTDIILSNASIDENNEAGATIGDFSTTDPDASDSHTYTLVAGAGDTDNASFTIDGITLKAASTFDFETQSSYSIRIKTDDGRGGSFEKNFTISVENVAEPEVTVSGTVEFPETQLGITVSTTITISNIGEAPVEVIASSAPADFSVTPGSVILMAGESRQVNVNFTPTQEATYSGNLVFTYNGRQAILPVSGIGAIVTGIDDELIDENEIRLYPNPASDIVNIDLSQVRAQALDITFVNAAGKVVNTWNDYRQKQLSIRVSDLDNGLYIIQLTDGKSVVRKKVIIRK